MLKLYDKGVYLLNGTEIVEELHRKLQRIQWHITFWQRITPREIWSVCRSNSIS